MVLTALVALIPFVLSLFGFEFGQQRLFYGVVWLCAVLAAFAEPN